MTERELKTLLKKSGWTIIHGNKHDMAVKEGISTKIPIPRHRGDIPKGILNNILTDAGLK